jgi:hypothetical protein
MIIAIIKKCFIINCDPPFALLIVVFIELSSSEEVPKEEDKK